MRKKAISPMIAVVLLIAFTVAVGGIVSIWLTSFAQDRPRPQEHTCVMEEKIVTERIDDFYAEFLINNIYKSYALEDRIEDLLMPNDKLYGFDCELLKNNTGLVTKNRDGTIYYEMQLDGLWGCSIRYTFNTTETTCLIEGLDCVKDYDSKIIDDFGCDNGKMWKGTEQEYMCLNDHLCTSYRNAQTKESCEIKDVKIGRKCLKNRTVLNITGWEKVKVKYAVHSILDPHDEHRFSAWSSERLINASLTIKVMSLNEYWEFHGHEEDGKIYEELYNTNASKIQYCVYPFISEFGCNFEISEDYNNNAPTEFKYWFNGSIIDNDIFSYEKFYQIEISTWAYPLYVEEIFFEGMVPSGDYYEIDECIKYETIFKEKLVCGEQEFDLSEVGIDG